LLLRVCLCATTLVWELTQTHSRTHSPHTRTHSHTHTVGQGIGLRTCLLRYLATRCAMCCILMTAKPSIFSWCVWGLCLGVIYIYTHTHVYIYIYVYTLLYHCTTINFLMKCLYIYINEYIYVYMYIYFITYIYTYMSIYVYIYIYLYTITEHIERTCRRS